MKTETVELVNWIKTRLSSSPTAKLACNKEKIESAIVFLNTLPELEAKLQFGGLIQDCTGAVCGHGDEVITTTIEFGADGHEREVKRKATLLWNVVDKLFEIEFENGYTLPLYKIGGIEYFQKIIYNERKYNRIIGKGISRQGEKNKMKIYIAGKITGLDRGSVERKFQSAAKKLIAAGHAVFIPSVLPAYDDVSHDEYLHICYGMIDICCQSSC